MFAVLMLPAAGFLSWLVWRLLGRTRLSAASRLLAAAAAGCLAATALYWVGIYGSILIFQISDPVTW